MEKSFGENFKGNKKEVICVLCEKHEDTEEKSFEQCEKVKEELDIEGKFSDIFKSNVSPKTANTINKITKLRERIIETKKKS